VQTDKEKHTTEFMQTRFTYAQATVQTDDIPITTVVSLSYKHGKPFVTDEEEFKLETQMFKFHQWYQQQSKEGQVMFGLKYHDHDFFRGDDEIRVDFECVHAIYRRNSLDISIVTCWVL
jgi:hypothetical protein